MIVTRIRSGWSKFRDYTLVTLTAQKMKFSIKDSFSKCDQMRRKLRIWPHILKKSLIEICQPVMACSTDQKCSAMLY